MEVEQGRINEKIKAIDEKNLKIIVKMAKIYEIEYLVRRKVTKLKRNQNMCNIIENANPL